MNKVAKGTKVTNEPVVNGTTVTRDVITQNGGKEGPYYQDTWTFDFKDVTRQELMILASRTLTIERQQKFRAAKVADLPSFKGLRTVVRTYLDSKRRRKSGADKEAEAEAMAVKYLSKEKLLELAEKYKAEAK